MGFFKRVANADCKKCGLIKNIVPPYGNGGKKILIIGDAPSYDDGMYGCFGNSNEYQELKKRLRYHDIDIVEDCFYMTSVSCYPDVKGSKKVLEVDKKHVEACRPRLLKFIANNDIKLIIAVGINAVMALYGDRIEKINGIIQWRGRTIPDQKHQCWVCPILTPQWLDDHSNDAQAELVWEEDFERAVSMLNKPFEILPSFKENIKVLMEYSDVVSTLKHIISINPKIIVFDYEANCLRPYYRESKLLTVSMFVPELNVSYAFPLFWRTHFTRQQLRIIVGLLRKIFLSKEIKFIAHNIPMEDSWTSEILGFDIQNWYWDTMVEQHLIDTTPKTKGLKFQAFVRFGVEGYDDYSKKWIEEEDDDEDAVKLNRLEEANLPKVLEYNSIDSLVTWMVYVEQIKEFDFDAPGNEKRRYCAELYNDVTVAFSRSSQNGFVVDIDYFEEQERMLIEKRDEIEKRINKDASVRLFKRKMKRPISITSADDLRILFYDIMGHKVKKYTDSGNRSADHESLTNMDNDVARDILEIRKIDKIVGTYIGQYKRLSVDGVVHPSYLLHVARTGRSSCVSPNMQNVNKRDAFAKKVVRKGIIPPEGRLFGEIDYDTLEVKIFACYCKDPALINYLMDEHSDMHRDQAMKIFLLDDEWQITKTIRFEAKNGWVFALFYGSYFRSCARNIWEKIVSQRDLILGKKKDKDGNPVGPDVHLKDHLRKKGIKSQKDFEAHLKKCEAKLWKIFHVTKVYQENAFKSALEKGYVESYSGFRRGGYIERGQIINTPVQGQGCQCLLDSYRLLWKQSVREQWKTKLSGQIHDSMLPMFHPTEVVHVLNSIQKVMCDDMVKKNDWLIVPMGVEASIAKQGDSWYDMIDFKYENGIWVSSKGGIPIEEVLELPKQKLVF